LLTARVEYQRSKKQQVTEERDSEAMLTGRMSRRFSSDGGVAAIRAV